LSVAGDTAGLFFAAGRPEVGNAVPLPGSTHTYGLGAGGLTTQTPVAPGSAYQSACTPSPNQPFGALLLAALEAHLFCLQRSLSQSSSASHSSPSAFLPAHLPPEHEPLSHSSSLEQSSPPAFFLPPHPGKPGGHSPVSAHCSGGSSPGKLGLGPMIWAVTGTVNGLPRVPEVATGSF